MAFLSQTEKEQLIGIMQSMLQAASEDNWQELSRLDESRRTLIGYTNGTEKPETTAEHSTRSSTPANDSINAEILRLDTLIITTVQNAKSKLLAENRELSAQTQAKARYALTSQIR